VHEVAHHIGVTDLFLGRRLEKPRGNRHQQAVPRVFGIHLVDLALGDGNDVDLHGGFQVEDRGVLESRLEPALDAARFHCVHARGNPHQLIVRFDAERIEEEFDDAPRGRAGVHGVGNAVQRFEGADPALFAGDDVNRGHVASP